MRPTAMSGSQGQTVLIVDDTPANVGVLVDYLEDHGFRVVVAQDGEEGLNRTQFARPDLILMDVMMPGMDGFETCRRLKAIESVKDIPVIFITALTDTNEKVTGFEAGGVDYVTKPFHMEEVLARVNVHLALRTMQQRLATQNQKLQQEIAARLQAEAELRLTQFSVDQAADAVFWLASDGRITYTNEAACRLLKYSSQNLLGMHVAEIEPGVKLEDWPAYWARIKERRSLNLETRVRAKGGTIIPLDVTVNYLASAGKEHAFVFARDSSERQHIEQSRYERETELEDVKKQLVSLQRQLQSEKPASVAQFAGETVPQVVSLHAGIDSALNVVSSDPGLKALLKKEYGDISPVMGFPAQLNQVFVNLLMNASQAIDGESTITIRSGHEDGWVWVEFADTGRGIEPQFLTRIFEPFFTTRPVGQGAGLGLSLSCGIVAGHGGRIEVRSDLVQGTVFRVWSPAVSV